jgi:hypothetical protein
MMSHQLIRWTRDTAAETRAPKKPAIQLFRYFRCFFDEGTIIPLDP